MTIATAFQANAFQKNGFQIAVATGCGFQGNAFQNNGFEVCGGPTACGFQGNAFQNNAFSVCGVTPTIKKRIGWPDTLRRRIPRKKLEQLLKLQKDRTFGRKWFEEMEQAALEFAQAETQAARAEEARAKREAAYSVAIAARSAREAAERADEHYELNQLAAALQVARSSKNLADRLEAARYAMDWAAYIKQKLDDEEDEEAVELLLMH